MATPVPGESTCVSVVVDQVGQVCNAAAGVASYVTGNAAIAKAVEKLLQLVSYCGCLPNAQNMYCFSACTKDTCSTKPGHELDILQHQYQISEHV